VDPNWKASHTSTDDAIAVWSRILTQLKEELSFTSYETWFKDVVPISLADDVFKIAVADAFTKGGIERRFMVRIATLLSEHLGRSIQLTVVLRKRKKDTPGDTISVDLLKNSAQIYSFLRQRLNHEKAAIDRAIPIWAERVKGRGRQLTQIDMLIGIEEIILEERDLG